MSNFLPVILEFEMWAVVVVVTVRAHVFLGLRKVQLHQGACFQLLVSLDEFDVLRARSVAILTLIAKQVRRLLGVLVAGLVPQDILRLPTGRMARQTLRIERP